MESVWLLLLLWWWWLLPLWLAAVTVTHIATSSSVVAVRGETPQQRPPTPAADLPRSLSLPPLGLSLWVCVGARLLQSARKKQEKKKSPLKVAGRFPQPHSASAEHKLKQLATNKQIKRWVHISSTRSSLNIKAGTHYVRTTTSAVSRRTWPAAGPPWCTARAPAPPSSTLRRSRTSTTTAPPRCPATRTSRAPARSHATASRATSTDTTPCSGRRFSGPRTPIWSSTATASWEVRRGSAARTRREQSRAPRRRSCFPGWGRKVRKRRLHCLFFFPLAWFKAYHSLPRGECPCQEGKTEHVGTAQRAGNSGRK